MSFRWGDALLIEEQLSAGERQLRYAAREYCQGRLMPRVLQAQRKLADMQTGITLGLQAALRVGRLIDVHALGRAQTSIAAF